MGKMHYSHAVFVCKEDSVIKEATQKLLKRKVGFKCAPSLYGGASIKVKFEYRHLLPEISYLV